MVDPVGGVGRVQDIKTFPRSDRGEAVTVGGGGASVCGVDKYSKYQSYHPIVYYF